MCEYMHLCMRACSFASVFPVFTDGSVTKDGSWGGLTARQGATSIHWKQSDNPRWNALRTDSVSQATYAVILTD